MPDAITPVGTQVKVDPMQGINMLSGVLGIQRQQAALPGIRAESQMQQQTAGQRQGLAQYFQTHDMDKHVAADGTIDLNVLSDPELRQAAGDSFPQIAQNLLTVKNSQLEAKSRLAGLNDTLRNQFDRSVASLREDPDVKADNRIGRAKVQTAMDTFSSSGGPDAQRIAEIYGGMLQHVPQGRLQASLGHLQMQAQSATEQQGQQNPVLGTQFDTTGHMVGTAQNRATGAFGQAPGGMAVGLGPKETPAYQGAMQAATTAAAGAGSVDNQVFGGVMTASANSGTVVDLAKKVRDLAAQVRTGKLTGEFADNLTILQQHNPEATARQLMEKYAENLKTAVEKTGATDSEREQIGSGFPTPKTMNPDALEEAAGYAEGTGHLARARGENAMNHMQQHGTTQGLAVTDNAFMKDKSPLTYAPKAAAQSTRVRVKSPDGKTGTIPASRLSAYKAQGYTEAQ